MHTTRSLDAMDAAAHGACKVAACNAAEGVEKPFIEQDRPVRSFGYNELVPQNVNEQELIP
jgi:hypothetical protein